jgi:hypothetical protein
MPKISPGPINVKSFVTPSLFTFTEIETSARSNLVSEPAPKSSSVVMFEAMPLLAHE